MINQPSGITIKSPRELDLMRQAGKILAESIANGRTAELELFEKIKHRNFPGGRLFRMPLLVTISAMQRMADIFNV